LTTVLCDKRCRQNYRGSRRRCPAGAINAKILNQAALPPEKIQIILERSFDLSAAPISKDLQAELRANLIREFEPNQLSAPVFARNLTAQPRSGAAKPGAAKLVFDAPENHAEHCITVAIYAVLLTPVFGANIETVFLAALAHHFHNAYLPDSGFAGEELLGEFLPIIFKNLREKCLAELPENLRGSVRQTFILTEHAETPEAKAFHAADVIDRVLQMRHHAEINEFTLKYALEEQELVHAGAIQKFHYEVLQQAKLI
jgi:hypothetical protein